MVGFEVPGFACCPQNLTVTFLKSNLRAGGGEIDDPLICKGFISCWKE